MENIEKEAELNQPMALPDTSSNVPAISEPGSEVAVTVESEGVLVCGDQSAVTRYVAELRSLVSEAIDTVDVSPVVVAHGAAVAAAGLSIAAHAGEYVRLSPATVEVLKTAHRLPVGNGFFRGVLTDGAGKFVHQVQWQRVTMPPIQLTNIQMLAMQVALSSAIASVEKSVARVEGKVERLLALAEASRAGDVRGHYVVLSRLTDGLDEGRPLTNTDWESVASLGPDLVVAVERLREHVTRTLKGFDVSKPIHERADYLRRAVEDNRLGETLHLLVISEQSLYLWQRLRITRVQATEPQHLQAVLDDARSLLADSADQDRTLLHHARTHLSEYAHMNRLDGFRWGATHNLSHDIVQLRTDIDEFALARGRQVAEWVDSERPMITDALAEVGSRAVSAGGAAASAAGRALGAGLSGVGSGLGVVGRGVGQLIGLSDSAPEDKAHLGTTGVGSLRPHIDYWMLRPGEQLRYDTLVATVTEQGQLEVDGTLYDDPSQPLIEKVGRARNGWRDWRTADGRSLRDLSPTDPGR
ncbi:MAG: DUF4357 domain-containing protein [Rhodococcus sp.]|nr:DUF4357 domain-containing protein [Rhodococcus sp. (in: high G+C Gram-positive bacteria)]